MSSASAPPYETILRLCQQAGREPWYPNEFAKTLGADPRKLEAPIDDLLYAGLIEQAQGQSGRGPGYRLTRSGIAALESPREMARLRAGELPHQHRDSGPEPDAEFQSTSPDRRAAVLACLRGGTRPWATYALLAANIGMFIWALNIVSGGNWGGANWQNLLLGDHAAARHRTGAVYAEDIALGQWWRVLTSIFVHRDIFHLLINMSTFVAFGRRAEQQFGCWRFLLIYLISGFASTSIALWNDPSISPIGASGSVCGTLLAIAVWYMLNVRHMPRELFREGLRQVIMAFVWWMLWFGLLALVGNVKFWWVGHFAGAAAGAAIGATLCWQRFLPNVWRWAFLLLVPLVPAVCVSLLIQAKEKSPAWKEAVAEQQKAREKWQQGAAARAKEKQEDKDYEKFNDVLMPLIIEARKFKNEKWGDVRQVCKEPHADRRMADVADALAKLREGKVVTDAALDAVTGAGPIEVDHVEKAVIAARNYLRDQQQMLKKAEVCLTAGAGWTEKDRKDLDDQEETTDRTLRIFNGKLKN